MEQDILKRYSAAEVTLLAIFTLGLAFSLLLVNLRNRVELDEPIALPPAGIAAPLPKGTAWETAGGWRYEMTDSAFVLLGRMRLHGRAMDVRWLYTLCDEPIEPEESLQQRAQSAGGRLEMLGIAPGQIEMLYGRVYVPSETGEMFLIGVAQLDFGRRLELHIVYRGDSDFAENAFLSLAAAVTYEKPERTAAGADRVRRFYADRLKHYFDETEHAESAFLIKDPANRPLGYSVRRLFAFDSGDDNGHRRITTRQLDADGSYSESDMWLANDDNAFTWTTQTWTQRSHQPRIAELRADAAGRLTVQTNAERVRILQRTPMMLPDIFLSAFAAEMLDAEAGEIFIDILEGNGFVAPMKIAAIDPAESPVRTEQSIAIVRAEYLHVAGAFIDFVFDPTGRLLARFEQEPRRPGRLWDSASPEQLQQIFGERFTPRNRQAVWLEQ